MGTAEGERLRHSLVDALARDGAVRSPRIATALRAVPRHVFVPRASLATAYANDVVQTKLDENSMPISAASQPAMVALMLEQLQAQPGDRVLEIGAGTGYNAALLAQLAGPDGAVTTIDVDEDITRGAAAALRAAGYPAVRVIRGDGALGYLPGAPYDRIIATVAAWDLPPAWLAQLAPAGRLVVPLRLRGSVTRSVAFERDPGAAGTPRWRSVSSQPCSFMPLRGGVADDPAVVVPLTPDGSVSLVVHQDQNADVAALSGAWRGPPVAQWTGVAHPAGDPLVSESLMLWLSCTLAAPLSRMNVRQPACHAIEPLLPWGTMAAVDGASLAYLTARPASGPAWKPEFQPRAAAGARELGVIGHGPRGADMARAVAAGTRAWSRRFRAATARFVVQPAASGSPPDGRLTFRTPNCWLSVSWEPLSITDPGPRHAKPRAGCACQPGAAWLTLRWRPALPAQPPGSEARRLRRSRAGAPPTTCRG
jgi:protein-L-isoaspartate(D-aspartate) O-methyltransferase